MNDAQKEIAQKALCDWLSARKEMNGKPPKKIEFMYALKDDEHDGLIFFVFKFKKNTVGKYLIGIAGGFENEQSKDCTAVFSGFDEFPDDKDEAVALAFKMADYILFCNDREKVKDAFDKNLKYIGKTEIDPDKIAGQFVKTNTRYFLTVGTVDIPGGKVVTADPLCYLYGEKIAPVLDIDIPKGSYPVEVSICRKGSFGIRMCTARLKIKETAAVKYKLAESVPGTAAAHLKDGDMSGFPVDAGMMCFIDSAAADEYSGFLEKWHKDNPGKNHYDDYFAAIFAESYKNLPQFQREGGDFIEWTIPDTGKRMVMIASGFGDGFYQSFAGYDESGDLCEIIVPMVDPDLYDN